MGLGSCPSALQIFHKIAVQDSGLTISVFPAGLKLSSSLFIHCFSKIFKDWLFKEGLRDVWFLFHCSVTIT